MVFCPSLMAAANSSLKLWFIDESAPTLAQTEFKFSADAKPQVCSRGQLAVCSSYSGTFYWSRAVQAVCLLFLRSAYKGSTATISGGTGSLAASLDYALSKEPLWLCDMFGVLDAGGLVAKRLFRRVNPERKRAGDVIISLNVAKLPVENISVFIDDKPLPSSMIASALSKLFPSESFAESTPGALRSVSVHERPFSATHRLEHQSLSRIVTLPVLRTIFGEQLRSIFQHEIVRSLHASNIFSRSGEKHFYQSLLNDPTYCRIAGDARIWLPDELLSSSEQIGLVEEYQCEKYFGKDQPTTKVAISPAHVATRLLFKYLVRVRGLRFEVLDVPHSVEMAKRLMSDYNEKSPALCSLSFGTSAVLIGSSRGKDYRPITPLPKMSHGIVAPSRLKRVPANGNYHFMSEVASSEFFCFEELVRHQKIQGRRCRITHAEPRDSVSVLSDRGTDARLLIGFPYYQFYMRMKRIRSIELQTSFFKDIFLFGSKQFRSDGVRVKTLTSLLRDAWLALIEDVHLRNRLIDECVYDDRYLKFLGRCADIRTELYDFSAHDAGEGYRPPA